MTNIDLSDIEQLYVSCMNCAVPTKCCPGVWKDIRNGVPPRGFSYTTTPVDILVVAKNPGHPFKEEIALLQGKSGAKLLTAYKQFLQSPVPKTNKDPDKRSRHFHLRLQRYLKYLLDVEDKDIPQRCAYTNLVKCSTKDERSRLTKKAKEECYAHYLSREIELFRPRVILALGREVERFLRSKSASLCCPVFYVKHPSYPYRRENECENLHRLKAQILPLLS